MRIALLVILSVSCHLSRSQSFYSLVYDLRFEEASNWLDSSARAGEPEISIIYLENYLLFIDALTSGNERTYQDFLRGTEDHLSRMGSLDDPGSGLVDDRRTGPVDDRRSGSLDDPGSGSLDERQPAYLHYRSLIHLQSAFLNLEHKDRFRSVRNYYSAWRMNRNNMEQHPGFVPDLKVAGLLEVIAASVPVEQEWVLRVAGIRGETAEGLSKLRVYMNSPAAESKTEAVLLNTLAQLAFNPDEQSAYRLIREHDAGGGGELLTRYVYALAAMKAGKNDAAIEHLRSIVSPARERDFLYPSMLLGEALLNALSEEAEAWLLQYLERYSGKNYLKAVCHKLSWFYFLEGDTSSYELMRRQVLEVGTDVLEADRQALAEAKDTARLHAGLLSARLLFDGGYYRRGIGLLESDTLGWLRHIRDSLEYTYRLGRLYHGAGDTARAVDLYLEVARRGAPYPWFFAANSLLQLGELYEARGETDKARHFYERCLNLDKHQYSRSIDHKARQGLDRIN